jgi:hypothetical protein
MTQTAQSCSLAAINKAEENLTKNKSEKEDNVRLLLTIYDDLNELNDKLNKLSVIGKRIAEHNLNGKLND